MVGYHGLFANSPIAFSNIYAPPCISVAQWAANSRFRPSEYTELESIFSMLSEPLSAQYCGNQPPGLRFVDFPAIMRHPTATSPITQLAMLEFYTLVVDFEPTLSRKLTGEASDIDMRFISRSLRFSRDDAYKCPPEWTLPHTEPDCNYGIDLSRDLLRMINFYCETSYLTTKADPRFSAETHSLRHIGFLESETFEYLMRLKSIVDIGTPMAFSRSIQDDVDCSATCNIPRHFREIRRKGRGSFKDTDLILNDMNADCVELLDNINRYRVYSKLCPMSYVGVLISMRKFLVKTLDKERARLRRAMLPTMEEFLVLNSQNPDARTTRDHLEMKRKNICRTFIYRQQMIFSNLVWQLFKLYHNFVTQCDPKTPQSHMAAVMKKGPPTPLDFIDFRKATFREVINNVKPDFTHTAHITYAEKRRKKHGADSFPGDSK
ncbi:Oidioi.mRNA.OKI2018_I69.chr1.g2764.t1.cds [Oikopleura dioica]|uniref:Oidioi.mRNA.OKI2018_I69.chr1.g2764.t1.cds n=1 Tax=Oikopleura dioica TaxID=34765 RepID=A0ABN7SVZ6_OIKDI|nr:Oidioi.mRNA.OKI2018_I69.chr1.g2764.t1.cds [Oikopleura dioica]